MWLPELLADFGTSGAATPKPRLVASLEKPDGLETLATFLPGVSAAPPQGCICVAPSPSSGEAAPAPLGGRGRGREVMLRGGYLSSTSTASGSLKERDRVPQSLLAYSVAGFAPHVGAVAIQEPGFPCMWPDRRLRPHGLALCPAGLGQPQRCHGPPHPLEPRVRCLPGHRGSAEGPPWIPRGLASSQMSSCGSLLRLEEGRSGQKPERDFALLTSRREGWRHGVRGTPKARKWGHGSAAAGSRTPPPG